MNWSPTERLMFKLRLLEAVASFAAFCRLLSEVDGPDHERWFWITEYHEQAVKFHGYGSP